jgi:rubrerythrin
LHAIYESIRKANKNTDVDFFVNSLINENWEINKKSLANDVKKIGRVLAEGYIYLGKDTEKLLPKENAQLDNAVRFIAENKKTKNNLAAYSDAVKIIKESIDSNEAVLDTVLTSNLDEVIEGLINDYNQKYDGMLTNDEVAIVQELANSDKKEEVFNKYKDSCKEKVAEAKENFAKAGDEKSAKRLSVVLEQIDAKKFSIDTAANDITALIKLTNIF